MENLVLIRHGQSTWNKKGLFTGWRDVELTEQGHEEAHEAGKLLKKEGFEFDIAFTSVLKRAIGTLWIVLDEIDQMWIPVVRSWKLNERHYGGLQGLDKAATVAKYGDEQVQIWRRSYRTPPPPVEPDDKDNDPKYDKRYAGIEGLPTCECLADTVERVMPYWEAEIAPQLKAGKRVLIAAHGNSLRALVKMLEGISDDDIVSLNIPTGVPRAYDLDENLKPRSVRYLGDPADIEARIGAVVNQTKAQAQ